jgi:hypothetical protein
MGLSRFSVSAQYRNEIIETDLQWEDPKTYILDNDTIISVGTIRDSNSTSTGFTHLEFRKYDLNYNLISNVRHTDSNYFKTGYYGLEKLKEAYYFCGTKYIDIQDTLLGFVTKFDLEGNLIWEKEYSQLYEEVRVVFMSSNDSLIYLFTNLHGNGGGNAVGLTAIDSSGAAQWSEIFTGSIYSVLSFDQTVDGGFVISYLEQLGAGDFMTKVIKLDSNRNILWTRILGKTTNRHSIQVKELPDGSILGFGLSEKEGTWGIPPTRFWLTKLDGSSGATIKDSIFNYDYYLSGFMPYSNVILRSNEFIISGVVNNLVNQTPYTTSVASYTYDFELNWKREYQHRNIQEIHSMFEKDGFYHIHGIVDQDSPINTDDVWFLVVDSLGCDDQMCTVGINEPMYEQRKLFSAYPNPSSGILNLEFSENYYEWEYSSFQLLDLTGKVLDQFQTNGVTTSYALDNLDNGIYLVQLLVEGQIVQTQKIVVNR